MSSSTQVSVSTTFFPGSRIDSEPSDIALLSSDSVFFYVHDHILRSATKNNLNSHLPLVQRQNISDPEDAMVIPIPETSAVLNVVLHSVYEISCAHYLPEYRTLVDAVGALVTYGFPHSIFLAPNTPLFTLLVQHAPEHGLDLYALAAQHNIHPLAVAVSPYLLSISLPDLSDAQAKSIGPVYLKRLFFLHLGRVDALKRALLVPPVPHDPAPGCTQNAQSALTRAWAFAAAALAWDARPDLPCSEVETALRPLYARVVCELCQHSLQERIKQVLAAWTAVKRSI